MGLISKSDGYKRHNEIAHFVEKAKFEKNGEYMENAARHRAHVLARTTLERVLEIAGFWVDAQQSCLSHVKYRCAGRASSVVISSSGEWYDNLSGTGGGGDYGAAALAKHLSVNIFSGEVPVNPVAAMKRQCDPLPKPTEIVEVASGWPFVRDYLISKRGIDSGTVDRVHKLGLVYSDARKNAVFAREAGGAFLRSTYSTFKQSVGKGCGAFVVQGDDRLYITEAPIDALSLLSLHPGATVAATGGNFPISRIAHLIECASLVWLSFDADEAGARMIEHVRDSLPQHTGKMIDNQPVRHKDWNDTLTALNVINH